MFEELPDVVEVAAGVIDCVYCICENAYKSKNMFLGLLAIHSYRSQIAMRNSFC